MDSLQNHYGLMIRISGASFAKQYYEKSGIQLIIHYEKNGQQKTDVLTPSEDTYFAEGIKTTSSKIVLTNYGSHRTLLRFNTSALLPRIVVNNARLVLKLDGNNSFKGREGSYSIVIKRITSSDWSETGLTISDADTISVQLVSVAGSPELECDVTRIVQKWFSDTGGNYGLLIKSNTENLDFSKFTFFYDPADTLKQPYITIMYSAFQK
jgi:hypothetical protein